MPSFLRHIFPLVLRRVIAFALNNLVFCILHACINFHMHLYHSVFIYTFITIHLSIFRSFPVISFIVNARNCRLQLGLSWASIGFQLSVIWSNWISFGLQLASIGLQLGFILVSFGLHLGFIWASFGLQLCFIWAFLDKISQCVSLWTFFAFSCIVVIDLFRIFYHLIDFRGL